MFWYFQKKYYEHKYELTLGDSLLDIGEQTWYADLSIERLLEDADQNCEKNISSIDLHGTEKSILLDLD